MRKIQAASAVVALIYAAFAFANLDVLWPVQPDAFAQRAFFAIAAGYLVLMAYVFTKESGR